MLDYSHMKKCKNCSEIYLGLKVKIIEVLEGNNQQEIKECSRCKQSKDANEFIEGRASCNKCLNYNPQYRETHRERERQPSKAYYETNREDILEVRKQYRENNRDNILEQKKQYRERNKDKTQQARK